MISSWRRCILDSFLVSLLVTGVAGCSARGWQTKDYASVLGRPRAHAQAVDFDRLFKVLDKVAQLLYAEGFLLQTNAPPYQPTQVFSHSYLGARLKGDYNSQTNFVLIETPDSSVDCSVQYDSRKTVYVAFFQSRITSPVKPSFPISPHRRMQIAALINRIEQHLQKNLPSYHVTVSLPQRDA